MLKTFGNETKEWVTMKEFWNYKIILGDQL